MPAVARRHKKTKGGRATVRRKSAAKEVGNVSVEGMMRIWKSRGKTGWQKPSSKSYAEFTFVSGGGRKKAKAGASTVVAPVLSYKVVKRFGRLVSVIMSTYKKTSSGQPRIAVRLTSIERAREGGLFNVVKNPKVIKPSGSKVKSRPRLSEKMVVSDSEMDVAADEALAAAARRRRRLLKKRAAVRKTGTKTKAKKVKKPTKGRKAAAKSKPRKSTRKSSTRK